MKNNLLALFLGSLFLISCNQKKMKISRSDYSVVTELNDISPAYIDQDKNGNAVMNKNNLIGNTHWVLSVNRELSLKELAVFLQELTDKKHKKGGMHEDTKDIYFIYSDTVHKQNAFVKLPFKTVFLEQPSEEEFKKRTYNFIIHSLEEVAIEPSGELGTEENLAIFDEEMNAETFINTLIEFEKQDASNRVNEEVYIY